MNKLISVGLLMLLSVDVAGELRPIEPASGFWIKIAAAPLPQPRAPVRTSSSKESCGTSRKLIRQCGDLMDKYSTACLLGKGSAFSKAAGFDELCESLRMQMAPCGFDVDALPTRENAPVFYDARNAENWNPLAPYDVRVGMDGCAARDLIIAKGLFEIRPCQFRTPARLEDGALSFGVIQLFTDESVRILSAEQIRRQRLNTLFDKTMPTDCDGRVVGIEYHSSIKDPSAFDVSQLVDQMNSVFGTDAECAERDSQKAACAWASVTRSDAVASAALRADTKNGRQGFFRIGLRGQTQKPSESAQTAPAQTQSLVSPSESHIPRASRSDIDSVTAASSDVSIALKKGTFEPGEQVEVQLSNLPGSNTDWITLISAEAPESSWGQWQYTNGAKTGSWIFSAPAEPGTYEIRVYFDYPKGGFEVKARRALVIIRP